MAALQAAVSSQLAISFFSSLIVPGAEKNVVCSPLSISSALALVAAGSRGKTLKEIADALNWREDADGLAKALLAEAEKAAQNCDASCPVKTANNVWVDNEFKILDSYRDLLKSFAVNVGKADFKKHSSDETIKINSWIEDHTNKKIRDFFPPGELSEATKAVLVNALYFKGKWAEPFDMESTRDDTFHVSNSKEVQVKMMYHSAELKYFMDENSKCDLVELPYSSKAFSMMLIVPHEVEGLSAVQSSLSLSQVSGWISNVQSAAPQTVDVFLPRFKVSQKVNMKDNLKSLGINDMFSMQANLSGIAGSHDLFVSSAIHQAVIEVNEEGTEAAAATGFGVNFMSMPMQVRADKPFLFLIISNVTKSILFIGKIANPAA
uniref:Serine protease inhibitor n=1 Tax=Cyanea capillata TaxID=27804 RepID=SPI_CYACP|nr:RecName: Full=Serine protease inhibitor; AltName: Full=Jellypin; Short=JP; Flags: Precursor [Cyanea capillata]AAT35220.1 serine protease inhibitor jellypin [Cyanea capillata]